MGNSVFDILCVIGFVSALLLLLAGSEWVFSIAYKHISFFAKLWDIFFDSPPSFED